MAFAQQRQRPQKSTQSRSLDQAIQQQQQQQQQQAVVSDSDNDWHVISSASSCSPILILSESESSCRPSDTESDFSQPPTTFLPSHDGTGTFVMQHDDDDDDDDGDDDDDDDDGDGDGDDSNQMTDEEYKSALKNLTFNDGILDMLVLPQGTPSFMVATQFDSQHDEQKNLDCIPIHHPGGSSSIAILTIVWDNLKRLTSHLFLENDTNTIETLSNLMSEAVLEGCMPFGSHLHMDIESRSYLLEVE